MAGEPTAEAPGKDFRILYHHRTQGRGGEGVHIREVIRAMRKLGCRVDLQEAPGVDVMHATETGGIREAGAGRASAYSRLFRYLTRYAPQFIFELAELGYNLWVWRPLSKRLQKRQVDVFYERYAFFSFIGTRLAERRGIPAVLEVNEIVGIERARGQALPWLARRVEAAVFRRASVILVVSSFLKETLIQRGVDEAKIHVVPNAVREETLASGNASGEVVRQQLGLQDATIIGFVGQIVRWDRLDLLIDDMALLYKDWPDLRLLVVGPCRFMDELRNQVRRLSLEDAVILTGPVERSDVMAYIDAMDIGLLPHSNPFGSPIVMFEYMAMAKPVLAVDVGPVRDIIVDDINGCLFPAGDRDAFRDKLIDLLTAPERRKRIGARALSDVRERHTWKRNAEYILRIVAPLLQHEQAGDN
ncbi:glycosyltransferase family 4 protein [Thiolapillus sp.]